MRRALVLFATLALATAGQGLAQQAQQPQSPVLILDSARVLQETNLGQSVSAEIETAFAELAAENRRIEAELEAEEKSLTAQRAATDPAVFRDLANAFDEKVQRIRSEQDAKRQVLEQRREAEQQDLFTRVTPILSALGNAYGAVVIIDARSVILAADGVDITDQVIARINASQTGTQDAPAPDAPSGDQTVTPAD